MLYFRNDYQVSCIPEINEAFSSLNNQIYEPYGTDSITEHAKEILKSKMKDHDVDIQFVYGGTIANITMIRSLLASYEGIIACKTGHIVMHETGSIEATGHKIIVVDDCDGKVTADAVQKVVNQHQISFKHMVFRKAVYISNATELGTIYSEDELHALHDKCKELGLYLILDGERLGAALMSGVGYTLNDIAACCDMFTIGGTKNGALFGTAIVITNPDLRDKFRYVMKQSGALMAKSWLIALQFIALFENDAFYKNAKKANEFALQIQNSLHNLGYPLLVKGYTNQVFPALTLKQYDFLKEYVSFEIWDKRDDYIIVRLVTSFSTTQEEVNELSEYLKQAAKLG